MFAHDGVSYKNTVEQFTNKLNKGTVDTFIVIIQNEGLVVKARVAKSLELFPAERAVAIAKVLDAFAQHNRECADASKILDNTLAFVKARLLKRLISDDQQLAGLAGGGGNASRTTRAGITSSTPSR